MCVEYMYVSNICVNILKFILEVQMFVLKDQKDNKNFQSY